MQKFATVTKLGDDSGIIHYVEVNRKKLSDLADCGIDGPFKRVNITYKDRYEGRVCERCFKSYLATLAQG